MLHLLLRAASTAFLLACLLPAQVTPVNNTGCPNFAPPVWGGSPRLGQTITFGYQRRPTPGGIAFVLLGFPSGRGLDFNQPDTCVAGPCRLYPAPIGGSYPVVSGSFRASLPLAIPNDRALLSQTFSVQAGTYDTLIQPCFTLSQALSFAIQP